MLETMALGDLARACRVPSGWMHCAALEKPALSAGGGEDSRCGSTRREYVSICSVLAMGMCDTGKMKKEKEYKTRGERRKDIGLGKLYLPKFVMDDTMCAETHLGHELERRKGRIGAEASVRGRYAIHTGGVAPCKLKVGDLDSRNHRPHLHSILGGEHWLRPLACATGRWLHGKFQALPVEILA